MNIKNNAKQLLLYALVGGIATVVEWVGFYLLNTIFGINYLIATALAFTISTFANWAVGRLVMFKGDGKLLAELLKIYLVGILGLLMNLLFMWVAVSKIGIDKNFSKVIATGIVFLWNFFIRKFFIYKA